MSLTPQTAPLVVAFGHTARSGKDECAQTIYHKHSHEHGGQYDIAIFSFAKALRDEVHAAMFSQWEKDYAYLSPSPQAMLEHLCKVVGVLYDPDAKVDTLDPYGKQRSLLQYWGQMRREENPFHWINKVDEAIEARNPQIALITDLRYPNEFWWVDYLGGCKVKVERPGYQGLTPEQQAHPSERALDGYEFDREIIVPDRHLEQLRAEALSTFGAIIAKHNAVEFIELAGQISTRSFIAAPSL